jgi:hypothetical protein
MSVPTSVDLVQPWRKAFPLCRPPDPGNKADAQRFVREFPEGADSRELSRDGWTLGDVLRGEHEGGLAAAAPVIGGTAAVIAAKTRKRDGRRKSLSSELLKYVQDENLKSKLRLLKPNGE